MKKLLLLVILLPVMLLQCTQLDKDYEFGWITVS